MGGGIVQKEGKERVRERGRVGIRQEERMEARKTGRERALI